MLPQSQPVDFPGFSVRQSSQAQRKPSQSRYQIRSKAILFSTSTAPKPTILIYIYSVILHTYIYIYIHTVLYNIENVAGAPEVRRTKKTRRVKFAAAGFGMKDFPRELHSPTAVLGECWVWDLGVFENRGP